MRAFRYIVLVGLAALGITGCASTTATPAAKQASVSSTAVPTTQPAPSPSVQYTGRLSLSPTRGPSGSAITVSGDGLPASATLDLVWNSAKGSWKLDGANNEYFKGRAFQPTTSKLATVQTDPSGSFKTSFVVPDGFGFQHDVTLVQDGVIRNKANFDVDMKVTISPSSGPVGTPITVEARGIGYQYLYNVWQLAYDNKLTGWVSSVTTDGIAKVTIPATGAQGRHLVQIFSGTPIFPYLNTQQSPTPDRPSFTSEFTVTDGPPVLPPAAESQGFAPEPASPPAASDGPAIWAGLASGKMGTTVTLNGRGLPAAKPLDLLWFRVIGNRMSGQGWDESSTKLGTVTPDNSGDFQFSFSALDDLGGPHRIEARSGDNKLAQTSFTISPSAMTIQPASGPPGTDFTVHLKGGGWTETANIYLLDYDNAYLGYACAFNSQGDVTIHLPAAGEPGWHFIDMYPGIYKGEDDKGVDNFKIPQLTYQDHPGEKLPAFHVAFLVTRQ